MTTVAILMVRLAAMGQDVLQTTQFWSEVDLATRNHGKFGFQLDIQYSRQSGLEELDLFRYNQQLTIRPWVHYFLNDRVKFSFFSGLWNNYSIPEAGARGYPEYRQALQVVIKSPFHRSTIANRFRLENREIRDRAMRFEQVFRGRYQFRYTLLFNAAEVKRGTTYLMTFNELFINGGSAVTGYHLFDQNRVFVGLGYGITDDIVMETGYFNQTQLEANGLHLDVDHVWQLTLMINNL